MTTILWDTNGTEIVRTLAAERRAAGALTSGLALTLVVVANEKEVNEAQQAATTAAAAHPCRLLVVVRRKLEADDRLGGHADTHLGYERWGERSPEGFDRFAGNGFHPFAIRAARSKNFDVDHIFCLLFEN